MKGGHNFDDLTGKKFFRLTVLERTENRTFFSEKYNRMMSQTRYLCRCICGGSVEVSRSGLIGKKTQSCGCYRKEVASEKAKNTLNKYAKINGKIIKDFYKKEKSKCTLS